MESKLKYLYEVAAIVVAITLSLLVDEWREKRQQREETAEVLKLIKSDLESDRNALVPFAKSHDRKNTYDDFLIAPDLASDSARFWAMIAGINTEAAPERSLTGYSAFVNLEKVILKNDSLFGLISYYYSNSQVEKYSEKYVQSSDRMFEFIEGNFSQFYRIAKYTGSSNDFRYENFLTIPGFIPEVRQLTDSYIFRNYSFRIYMVYQYNLKKHIDTRIANSSQLVELIEIELGD